MVDIDILNEIPLNNSDDDLSKINISGAYKIEIQQLWEWDSGFYTTIVDLWGFLKPIAERLKFFLE